jgi:hypothetical protein
MSNSEPLMPEKGSYRASVEQRIHKLGENYISATEGSDTDRALKLITELGDLARSVGDVADEYATELARVERLRKLGPNQQQWASVLLKHQIIAAGAARWGADPSLSKKALATKIEKERPDLGSWRTIERYLPREEERESWTQKGHAVLGMLMELGEKNTLGDPACQRAIHPRHQM